MDSLANSKDQDEMSRNASFHQGLYCLLYKFDLQIMKYNIFFWNYLLLLLNIYNGPSLLYQTLWKSSPVSKNIFFLHQNICCGYSKELSQWDGSFENPKHMVKQMGKKIFTILRSTYGVDIMTYQHLLLCRVSRAVDLWNVGCWLSHNNLLNWYSKEIINVFPTIVATFVANWKQSADNLCKQFGPRHGAWSGSNFKKEC